MSAVVAVSIGRRHTRGFHANIAKCTTTATPPSSSTMAKHEGSSAPFRRWEFMTKNLQRDENSFSVMTYNILADSLMNQHLNLYQHAPREVLDMRYRFTILYNEMRSLNADIMCLQEVDQFEFFARPFRRSGYEAHSLMRTGEKTDGLALFFRRNRFSLREKRDIYFRLTDDESALMNRDNVCLACVLEDNRTGKSVIVATTHLLYNPKRGEIKLGQLCVALAELGKLTAQHNNCPLILCGDFNLLPQSPLYEFIQRGEFPLHPTNRGVISGQVRYIYPPMYRASSRDGPENIPAKLRLDSNNFPPQELLEHLRDSAVWVETIPGNPPTLRHRLELRSVYRHYDRRGHEEVTTWMRDTTKATVDYIFACPGLRPIQRLTLLSRPQLDRLGGLPNMHQGSDHVPLVARFSYT